MFPLKGSELRRAFHGLPKKLNALHGNATNFFQLQRKTGKSKDRHHFKQVKYLVQSKIRSAYDNYLQDLLGLAAQSAEENPPGFIPKKLYALIKNARQDSQSISSLFDKKKKKNTKKHTLFTENKAKATFLNLQFQSVFSQLSPLRLGQFCIDKIRELFENIQHVIMPEIKIDENGFLKLLSNLKVDKAAGPDDIKPIVLKELRKKIASVIKAIFEKSLETGQLPKDWTTARVCPLFKKGDKCDPTNYRPISLTCTLCKVMEHIVASNLARHLNSNDILYGLQHGFREKRSCETQLIELVEDWGDRV